MFKLMKYEFRKQAFSKIIILAFLAIIELVFAFGIILDKENIIGFSVGTLIVLALGSMFYVSYEAIITYSNDLKNKCSYMLFLTPNTSFSILGAKLITGAIQVLLVGLLFLAVIAGDMGVLIAKYDQVAQVKEMLNMLLKEVFSLDISMKDVYLVSVNALVSWFSVITVAFLSITVSTTLLSNNKFKGVLSFAIFVAINWIFVLIIRYTIGTNMNEYSQTFTLLETLYHICFVVITYIGTALMLDKKLSV